MTGVMPGRVAIATEGQLGNEESTTGVPRQLTAVTLPSHPVEFLMPLTRRRDVLRSGLGTLAAAVAPASLSACTEMVS